MKKIVALVIICTIISLPVSAVSTSAKAAAVINGDTGEALYAQNADMCLPMASTTKIMTSLLLCEHGNLEKEITVTADMLRVEGSSMGLLPGDTVTLHDLLYGMLLASGNDAANVTAIAISGSVKAFAELMNRRAAELGLKNTHFVTPSGLDAEEHYTTARELALLAAFALKNEEFAKAAASKTATLCYGNPPYKRTLSNHNKLLKLYDGAIGVKTGFTKKSGRCLVSAARRDGKLAVAVTLCDPDDWRDHVSLLDYGIDSIGQTSYTPQISHFSLPVIGSDNEDLDVFIEPYIINTLETEKISCKIDLPRFLYAPVSRGETVGYAEYSFNGSVIETVEIKAPRGIAATKPQQSVRSKLLANIKYILLSI